MEGFWTSKTNVEEQYSQQQIDSATDKASKYGQSHECYVPDKHNDFHAQLHCILNRILWIQEQKRGIRWKFTIDGKTEYGMPPILPC